MSLPATGRNLAPAGAPNGRRSLSCRAPTRSVGAAGITVSLLLYLPHAAEARPARCYTSDDGFYECEFVAGARGGFTISAPGKPIVILNIDTPGIAFGFARLGGRNVALPGRYHRSATDRACWENDATGSRVCAWGGF